MVWAYHQSSAANFAAKSSDCQDAACPVYSNRVAPSKAAADVSDWTIARRKGPQPARPYGTPYTRSALPPIVPNGGLLSMSRSDEYRRFAAECLKMAQTAEEEQNRATFLQMARMWFALAEREEARSSRNDPPED
jgi:hypothetical protein